MKNRKMAKRENGKMGERNIENGKNEKYENQEQNLRKSIDEIFRMKTWEKERRNRKKDAARTKKMDSVNCNDLPRLLSPQWEPNSRPTSPPRYKYTSEYQRRRRE